MSSENIGDIEYLYRIRCHYDSLSKTQKRIANYILKHTDDLPHGSIYLLARKIGTNAPAITRFCKALGFKGFSELKFYMEQEILTPFAPNRNVTQDDSFATMKQKVILQQKEIIEDTLALLDEHAAQQAIKRICETKRLDIFGEGASSASALAAYCLFMQLAVPCRLYTDGVTAITCVSQLKDGDVALGIGYSGSTFNTVNFLKMAKERKAATIGITGYPNSPIHRLSDIPLMCSGKVKNDLRDMHTARMSELSIIGLLHMGIYNRTLDEQGDNMVNLVKATKRMRVRTSHNITF